MEDWLGDCSGDELVVTLADWWADSAFQSAVTSVEKLRAMFVDWFLLLVEK